MTDVLDPPAALYRYGPGGTLSYAVESYDEIIDDIKPLLERHWEELAAYPDIPLEPDYAFYKRATDAGFLRIFAARLNGALIGYAIFTIVQRHPHYMSQSFAVSDIVLVVPEHRNARVATGLFDLIESNLAGFVITVTDKTSHPALGALMRLREYEALSTAWSKRAPPCRSRP